MSAISQLKGGHYKGGTSISHYKGGHYKGGTSGQDVPEFLHLEGKHMWIHGDPLSCTLCSSCHVCCQFCLKCNSCTCCDMDSCAKCKVKCGWCIDSCTKCRSCECCEMDSCAMCKAKCGCCISFCCKCRVCDPTCCVDCPDSCQKCCATCNLKCAPLCLKCSACECGPQINLRAVGCELCPGPLKILGNWHISTDYCPEKCPAFIFPLCNPGCPGYFCCVGAKDETFVNGDFTNPGQQPAPITYSMSILKCMCAPPAALMRFCDAPAEKEVEKKETMLEKEAKKQAKKAAEKSDEASPADVAVDVSKPAKTDDAPVVFTDAPPAAAMDDA